MSSPVLHTLQRFEELLSHERSIQGHNRESVSIVARSPFDTLPLELLLMIFDAFLPQSHNRLEHKAILDLTSVCTYWRQILHSIPSFWTYVNLSPSRTETIYSPSYPSRLVQQLQRTGTALLNVRWFLSGAIHPEMGNIIHNHAPLRRWHTLSVHISIQVVKSFARKGSRVTHAIPTFPYILGKFTSLKEMTLHGDAPCPHRLAELVERTALRLHRLEVSKYHEEILNGGLYKASKRAWKVVVTERKPTLRFQFSELGF